LNSLYAEAREFLFGRGFSGISLKIISFLAVQML